MNLGRYVRFAICVIVGAVVLHLFSYDGPRVALLRLGNVIWPEPVLKENIRKQCSGLTAATTSPFDTFFAGRFSLPVRGAIPAPGQLASAPAACLVSVRTSHLDRFHLISRWAFLVRITKLSPISANDATVVYEQPYQVEFPKPLVLLPFVIFLLMLIFGFYHWPFWWLVALYLSMLSGLDIPRLVTLAGHSAWTGINTDQTFIGLLLFIAWATLIKSIRRDQPFEHKPWQNHLSQAANVMIGLWNPVAYTILGRLLYPFRKGLNRVRPFLEIQCFVAVLSVYLFSYNLRNFEQFFTRSLLLPRYFSFAIFLFFATNTWRLPARQNPPLWNLNQLLRSLLFVVGVETAAYYYPPLAAIKTLPRVAGALLLSELLSFRFQARDWGKHFLPWAGVACLCSLIPTVAQDSGLLDLTLTLCDPRLHPVGLGFFTFLGAAAVGFFTGSFSVVFFGFLTLMLKTTELPLVRGALFDGILLGILLSPFSPLNLFAAMQFGIRLQELVSFRFKQLAIPFFIGAITYIVAAANSVRILQPATFVSLCLVAVAWQLKKRNWLFQTGTSLPS
jgi:hypothetical protein